MGILNGLNDNINIAEKGNCILCVIFLRTTFSFLEEILKRNILMHFIAIAKVILPLSYLLNDIIHVSGVMSVKATIVKTTGKTHEITSSLVRSLNANQANQCGLYLLLRSGEN